MLSFNEFTRAIVEKLREGLGYKYDIQVTEIEKNNHVIKPAIMAGKHGEYSNIVVYMQEYYEEYKNGISIEQIIYSIGAFIQGNQIEIDIEEIKDFDKIKDRLFFRLINYKANKAALGNIPHIKYLDLAIVFSLGFKDEGYMTMTINNNLMEVWGKSVEELYEQTKKNTPLLFDVSFNSMNDVLLELAKKRLKNEADALEDAEKTLKKIELPLYILTNEIGINGSAVMLYEGTLKEIAEGFGSDLIILPSSIHEVLILAYEEDLDIDELKEMVYMINRSEVPVVDILSDNVYRYSREEDKVYMVTED